MTDTAVKTATKAALTPKADKTPAKVKVACPTPEQVKIVYGSDADATAMTEIALTTLREICSKACIKSVTISSTARGAADQARVMYDMIKREGTEYAYRLYSAQSDKIVAVYEESKKNDLSAGETIKAMTDKINEIGPEKISKHFASGDGKLCVFDVGPRSLGSKAARARFAKEMKAHPKVQKWIEPPGDPAYHMEIPN